VVAGAVKIAKDYTVENLEEVKDFGSFDSNHLSLVRDDGAMDLYHGGLRAIDRTARRSSTTSITNYLDYIVEEVRPWSYMKFPFIKSLGPETAGTASARWRGEHLRLHRHPEAEAARKEFMAVTDGQAQQHDDGLPLGADDRGAALAWRRSRSCSTTRTCRAPTW
jgi:NAD-reducing hydrogenase large subunit